MNPNKYDRPDFRGSEGRQGRWGPAPPHAGREPSPSGPGPAVALPGGRHSSFVLSDLNPPRLSSY